MASLREAASKGAQKIQNVSQDKFCRKRISEGFVTPEACARQYQNWKASTQNWAQDYVFGIEHQ